MNISNNPPVEAQAATEVEKFRAKLSEFLTAALAWAEAGIEDEAQAEDAAKVLVGLRTIAKQIEEKRVELKDPHLAAGRAVDAAFKPSLESAEKAMKKLKAAQTTFLAAEKRKAQEAERVRIEAERAREEEAKKKAAEAEAKGDLLAAAEAEEKAAEAQRAQKAVDTGPKIRGGGTRALAVVKRFHADLVDVRAAVVHYVDHPDVADLVIRIANADCRAAKGEMPTIPGFKITEVEEVR